MRQGVLTIAAGTAMLAAALWIVFYGEAAIDLVRRRLSSPPTPSGPPIERLAADLRRLRSATQAFEPGTSQVKRVATVAAYDDALGQACRALGLPDTLADAEPGAARDRERLRVEALLEAEGLRFTSRQ